MSSVGILPPTRVRPLHEGAPSVGPSAAWGTSVIQGDGTVRESGGGDLGTDVDVAQ